MSLWPSVIGSAYLVEQVPSSKIDVGTAVLKLTPSSTDVGPYADTATEIFALTPSGTEILAHVFTDVATELYKLTPSGVDIRITVDAATELLALLPSTDEHYCPQKVEFEGDLDSRWSADSQGRWKADNQSRWTGDFLGIGEGFAC